MLDSVQGKSWLMLDLYIMGMVCAVCTYNSHALQLHELLHAALQW